MEITFYNETGHSRTYLSSEKDNSFYTWDGHAVAYLYDDKIYGWKGKHLGWYFDGVIYDLNGYKIGSTREKCSYSPYSEDSKFSKFSRHSRFTRDSPYSKPSLTSMYANIDLLEFITQDRV